MEIKLLKKNSCSLRNNLIIITANTAWSIYNFRKKLINSLKHTGYKVVAVAPEDEYADSIPCEYIPVEINRRGTNPLEDIQFYFNLRKIYKRLKPFAVLHFTSKVNIYGALAARKLGICCINNISGLGSAFIGGGFISHIQQALYRFALRDANVIFFQNEDDEDYFIKRKLARPEQSNLLPGSGVDVDRFSPQSHSDSRYFIFLMISRLIKDKGIYEYVQAAEKIKRKYPDSEFHIVGFLDNLNPSAIKKEELECWVEEELIDFLGRKDDVRNVIAASDCVVLPSYREGTPRTLLEAASMAKPIITTDVAGCRQVVDDGKTGFLCRVRDSEDLADKMEKVMLLSESERKDMGLKGREKMKREFDEEIVIKKYLEVLERYRS
ncbi:N,N'-diacetylbacillosaminyl-diphospho-undecaprenol alpha-1,3-N-acetylgalactosaminyltransferase [subsurface metagenome]